MIQPYHTEMVKPAFEPNKNSKDPRLPQSFTAEIKHPRWCEAINREYNELRKRNTCSFIKLTVDMEIITTIWVLKMQPLNIEKSKVLQKARCCVRGDLQKAEID